MHSTYHARHSLDGRESTIISLKLLFSKLKILDNFAWGSRQTSLSKVTKQRESTKYYVNIVRILIIMNSVDRLFSILMKQAQRRSKLIKAGRSRCNRSVQLFTILKLSWRVFSSLSCLLNRSNFGLQRYWAIQALDSKDTLNPLKLRFDA